MKYRVNIKGSQTSSKDKKITRYNMKALKILSYLDKVKENFL